MSALKVSVIVPNFNRETLVGETISNLLAQTLPPHEIIVVDDGSTDQSVKMIQSFGAKIKLIEQANQGPGAARNAGLKVATGDFIQFQDSDDLYSRNKLEAQANLLDQTGADIAFSPWVKLKISGQSVSLEDQVLQQQMPPEKLGLACWWLRGWSTVFQSLLFRRSFLDRVGFYRTDLMVGEDGELFFRALTQSPRVAFTAEALTLYRLHNVNKLTQDEGTSQTRRIVDWSRCLKFMIEQRDECNMPVDRMTHAFFLAGVGKELRYLRALPKAPTDVIEFLSARVAKVPGWQLTVIEWFARLAEQGRLRTRGSRWLAAYQASAPTEQQRRLIQQLGFEMVQAP